MFVIQNKDIAFAEADIIVNAANGCGYMGGTRCVKALHDGVAEHLNYCTRGLLEQEALLKARKNPKIPAWICGTQPGDYFITESHGLNCKKVFHAVTMRYPGGKSKIKHISMLVKKILKYCHKNGYDSVALPALGCGTGRLSIGTVMHVIAKTAERYPDIKVVVYK